MAIEKRTGWLERKAYLQKVARSERLLTDLCSKRSWSKNTHTLSHNIDGLKSHIGVVILLLQDEKQQLFSKGSSVTRPKEWLQVKQVKQRRKKTTSYEANTINKKGGQQFQQHLTYKANPINRPEIKS